MMYFDSQAAYEHYHSPEQRRLRSEHLAGEAERVLSEARALFDAGDEEAAGQRLFDASKAMAFRIACGVGRPERTGSGVLRML